MLRPLPLILITLAALAGCESECEQGQFRCGERGLEQCRCERGLGDYAMCTSPYRWEQFGCRDQEICVEDPAVGGRAGCFEEDRGICQEADYQQGACLSSSQALRCIPFQGSWEAEGATWGLFTPWTCDPGMRCEVDASGEGACVLPD